MTKREENDKMIALFMGATWHPKVKWYDFTIKLNDCFTFPNWKGIGIGINGLKYSSSYDWLMEVVEKIEIINYSVKIENNICTIVGINYNKTNIHDTKFATIYFAITEFINFYNAQKEWQK